MGRHRAVLIKPGLVLGFFILWVWLICPSVNGQQHTVLALYQGSIGQKGDQPGQLLNPQGISIDLLGNIYIADTGNNRIQKFDKQGRFLLEQGGFGWEGDRLDTPVEVCARNGLDVFVADHNTNRIVRFDRNLNYITAYQRDTDRLGFGYPTGVTLNIDGDLFLIDGEHVRILKIDNFGEVVLSFGGIGHLENPLEDPVQIEADSRNFIYVADRGRGSLYLFDQFGNLLRELGQDRQWEPTGLGSGAFGLIYVVDGRAGAVEALSAEGAVLLRIAGEQVPETLWGTPVDCAGFDDTLFVLDGETSMVHRYKLRRP